MLKGTKVNLRILERSDLPLLQSWVNDIDFVGEFEPFAQQSLHRMEKDFDGLQTYKEMIKQRPGQKAIIVSGFSATERVQEMQRLGAGQYVKKPYSRETIGRAVRKELDKEPL